MTQEQLRQFLNINVALSAEQDREALLTFILDTAIDMAVKRCIDENILRDFKSS